MKSSWRVRRRVVSRGPNPAWIVFVRPWRSVAWLIWALKEILSHGGTVAIVALDTFESGLTGPWLVQIRLLGSYYNR